MSEQYLRETPFHDRIAAVASAQSWERWQGHITAVTLGGMDREYFAIRNSASVYDVSPLIKYRITGADAARFVDRLITRDVARCAIGQAYYTPWCDDDGKVIEDGTLFRLGKADFLLNAALHNLHWLRDTAYGFDVTIEDVSAEIAGLSVQGPLAQTVLIAMGIGGLERLAHMRLAETRLDDRPMRVSRTGFTGDLGYELWIRPGDASWLWDRLMAAGALYNVLPIGSAALNHARIEAGFILVNVDFISATYALRPSQKRSPYELGLGWAVNLKKDGYFIGKRALLAERKAATPRRALVGLEIDGRKPAVDAFIYAGKREVGRTTSAIWSPTLKKNIAIASIAGDQALPGTELGIEIWHPKELKIERSMVGCRVVHRPFYDPPRKKA
ncbi:aminomethyltransferase family protein [Rhodospirillaceae bacterium SYSU D60014]|uniref:aminomethyltransferase family protein n=1 Tax=Virgifigura deserti TaxID=2268457 RepID=UPI000E669EC0